MTRPVAVIGGAASRNGKLQTRPDAPLQVLEHEILAPLVLDAMAAANLPREEIDALVLAMCRPYTLQKYFATYLANYLHLPLTGTIMEVLGNGMTGGLAFDEAANAVALGHADVALALGVNMESQVTSAEHAMNSMRATGDVDFHTVFGFTPIAWYAMDAVRYMHEYGATRAQLASVAVKDRRHASLNPIAQFRGPLTLDEVLAARPIVEPLGLYEVPPRGDGAVCLVVCAEDVAKATGRPYALLRGRGFFHEGAHQINEVPNDMTAFVSAQRAATAAYRAAGVTAADLDLAEVYAPCTIVEVLVSEAMGLAPRGLGAELAAAGETALGGRIPICTSGGCLSRGHPAYVTGLLTIYELWEQLTHRAGERQVPNARLAAGSCELGNYNAALIHILEAVT
jgi:acetyl-CoA C-acetyltransferase